LRLTPRKGGRGLTVAADFGCHDRVAMTGRLETPSGRHNILL
jgi:hypothetical protein